MSFKDMKNPKKFKRKATRPRKHNCNAKRVSKLHQELQGLQEIINENKPRC